MNKDIGTGGHVEIATRLLALDSVSVSGTERVVNYLSVLMQTRGLYVQTQDVRHSLEGVAQLQRNVLGVLGDPLVDRKMRRGLLLCSHLDTVPPGIAEHWTETRFDPHRATIEEGHLIGLGAIDGKSHFLCQLEALEKFRERKLKMPIYLVGTCGEELGMFGVRYLIQSGAVNPKYIVIGKPTGLQIVTRNRLTATPEIQIGYTAMERGARGFNRRVNLHVYGRTAHPSFSKSGDSAVLRILGFFKDAREAGFELKLTKIEGGSAANQIPDWASADVFLTSHQLEDFKRFFKQELERIGPEKTDKPIAKIELGGIGESGIRFLPDTMIAAIVELQEIFSQNPHLQLTQIRQSQSQTALAFDLRLPPEQDGKSALAEFQSKANDVATRFPSLNLKTATRWINPGFSIPTDHLWVQTCRSVLKEIRLPDEVGEQPFGSEAGQFVSKGFDAVVVFGPGDLSQNGHGPNEKVKLVDLEKAVRFYERLIERVCV